MERPAPSFALLDSATQAAMSRRKFVEGTLAAAASAPSLGALSAFAAEAAAPKTNPPRITRKIKVGLIGYGMRGSWIAGLFQKHGGYEFHAVAEYFPEFAEQAGNALGVEKTRRFSGLSAYRRLIDSGVEAVIIKDIPCFYPEQAKAAVEAGCHVYIAKPVATDVPGCLAIEAAGKQATQKKLCFLVDYQMPTDPISIEVAKRIWDGGMGKVLVVTTLGGGGGSGVRGEVPKGKTIESRFRGQTWTADLPLGGDLMLVYDIHAIDAAIWILRRRPVAALGRAQIYRTNPQSDAHDATFVTYEFPDGLLWNHQSLWIPDHGRSLVCNVHGQTASAQLSYWGKSFLRGGPKHYGGGEVVSLYDQGAMRNIAEFHRAIVEGRFDNPTVPRAVDGTLTGILGREAAARGTRLTMDDILKENKRLTVDLTGLKV